MTDIHGQKGGEMLQYLEMSAVLPAGFSQLWSMGNKHPPHSPLSAPRTGNGGMLICVQKIQKIRKETKLWQRLRSAKKKKNV